MANFRVIPLEEAQRLVLAPRRLSEAEYRRYVRALDDDTAGRIELSEGDRPISVRARLKAAAKAEGRTLEIQRNGDTLVFWLKDSHAGR